MKAPRKEIARRLLAYSSALREANEARPGVIEMATELAAQMADDLEEAAFVGEDQSSSVYRQQEVDATRWDGDA